ncbi:1-acyl-sn-glycerol-3-phosphate acyltransferase [Verrucomicrobium sp. GAS474]|uniref:lysophospholipid acyltransferase family protein n=1 Tax=Verrucomicrobium sp. GAS474 TaxID=1882831 RepID=UPI00087CB9C6|nr:lysophospholipid acyltransferase family protein [Verrucomicrobium sp. GAS474]SDU14580.1 1-acyl-sn-glycerol-3-phosphate acyltransferase [Verrucomicrobium sp. GAS474]
MRLWYAFARGLAHLLMGATCGITYEGRENLKGYEKGGLLIVSNHLSFLDPPMVACGMTREIHFLARKTLFKKNGFGWLISSLNSIPVDQDKPDMNGLRIIIKRLKEGCAVILFPEGARALDGRLQPGAPGAGLVAAKAGVPILPVRLFGSYEALPRGTAERPSKFRRHPLRVVIGKPYLPDFAAAAEKGKTGYEDLSREMMGKIAELS